MSKGLNDLHPAPGGGSRSRIIAGRGASSRRGHKAGRGNKGHKARTGYAGKRGFEGGQMPLQRRVPKRGFTNIFKIEYNVVNLEDFDRISSHEGAITPEVMHQYKLVRNKKKLIKILARGKIEQALEIQAHAFSEAARQAIEAAGGKAVVLP